MDQGPTEELPELQTLALAHAPARAREAVRTLLVLDNRLANFVSRGHEPMLAQMRLAWWRDRLAERPAEWPQGDPLLARLAQWQDPAGLGPLVDGWERLLGETLDAAAIDRFAAGRGAAFAVLAEELGAPGREASSAGRSWALGDLAANLSDPSERERVLALAVAERTVLPSQRALRPLAILGGLGRRAIARGGRPLLEGRGAALTALRVGLFGR